MPQDALLFLEQGVYYCLDNGDRVGDRDEDGVEGRGSEWFHAVPEQVNLYLLEEDLQARGLSLPGLVGGGQLVVIDYDKFVDLSLQYALVRNGLK